MKNEPRDEQWAAETEELLRKTWGFPGQSEDDPGLEVRCRTTVCAMGYTTQFSAYLPYERVLGWDLRARFDQMPLAEALTTVVPGRRFAVLEVMEAWLVTRMAFKSADLRPGDPSECLADRSLLRLGRSE